MKTSTLILLCATVFGAGLAQSLGGRSEKYLCRGKLMQSVYPNTVFCAKTEIIMGKTCLNPEGKLGKRFLMRKRLEEWSREQEGFLKKN
uniref:Chemokine interleukin-8-like domain-containing protein n=1 Tax=Oncorhynchus mykiss TaxID=8022 RepID=A0A8C7U8G8_ONCMY